MTSKVTQEAISGAIAGLVTDVSKQLISNGFDPSKTNWKDVAKSSITGAIGGSLKEGMKVFNESKGLTSEKVYAKFAGKSLMDMIKGTTEEVSGSLLFEDELNPTSLLIGLLKAGIISPTGKFASMSDSELMKTFGKATFSVAEGLQQ